MIPLSDDNPTHHPPVVTIAFIAVNVLVFLWQIMDGSEANARKVFAWSTVPYNVTHADESVARIVPTRRGGIEEDFGRIPPGSGLENDPYIVRQAAPGWVTLFTSMFMHGGWLHLLGNMLFLWVFGNNIEDATGKVKFAVFYLGSGLAAGLVHVYSDPDSFVPTLGASGAVSGVLGGYLLLFPKAHVHALIPLPYIWTTMVLPAMTFLFIWFGMQVFNVLRGGGGNVAWYAHIGGFVFGLALIKLLESSEHRARPKYVPAGPSHRLRPRGPFGGY